MHVLKDLILLTGILVIRDINSYFADDAFLKMYSMLRDIRVLLLD